MPKKKQIPNPPKSGGFGMTRVGLARRFGMVALGARSGMKKRQEAGLEVPALQAKHGQD